MATCIDCNTPISNKVMDFSKTRYGKLLCMPCQGKNQKLPATKAIKQPEPQRQVSDFGNRSLDILKGQCFNNAAVLMANCIIGGQPDSNDPVRVSERTFAMAKALFEEAKKSGFSGWK